MSEAASVVHELLTDLAAIATYGALVSNDLQIAPVPSPEEIRSDLEEVRLAVERAQGLGLRLATLVASEADE